MSIALIRLCSACLEPVAQESADVAATEPCPECGTTSVDGPVVYVDESRPVSPGLLEGLTGHLGRAARALGDLVRTAARR